MVPVTKYEIYGRRGLRIIETEDEDECISFTARVPDVLIEAVWDSGDDMDLSVREPDGTLVNYLHTKSSCGSLGKDNSVDACGIFLRGHERITYQRECLKQGDGKYEAILRHTVNCGHGATSWVLKVVVDGRFRRVIRGVSNGSDEMVAASIKFRL